MSPFGDVHDPLAEALLYVEWVRGAGGRFLPAEAAPAVSPAAGARPRPAPDSRLASAALAAPLALADPARWGPLEAEVAACRRCGLCATRTQTVFGSGSKTPRLVVIGEAPGAEEDRQGLPFVGPAGELLTRMLAAIGLSRENDVYIANVLKCRPPENRPPRPDEAAACRPYLREQLGLMGPPLLLALGNHACRALLGTERNISSLRGRFTTTPEGWRVMPTFHPAFLLRNPGAKREVWEDLKQVAQELGLRGR